ncbi:MAG: restriction endonuclease subunit M [Winogradskyella sp.]|nr:restriction endonuclease subunit M [Winogradskyella sp.]
MSLFQNSVLNKYLKGLESEKVNQAYERFTSHFHNPTIQENIRNSKEEQYQGEFLIDLFVKVFGYIKNPTPDFNLTTELKNIKGSKKTDGAILKGEKALAVIELKGTNTTDLGKVETQAFGYKNNQPGCNYVITSNFEKLRFYIDNAVDFEEFNLFQLSKERFDILWLCLSSEYLLKDIPKKIKDESLTQEENVTKKLYKDYASFRNEIFDAIQKENPEYDKLTLFKKTQKLLDRFLFIFFAEDRLLLPPNSIRSIVNQWTDLRDKYDEYFPLYDRFKKYFGYMNTGHKGQQHDIFAYNGGLFAPDEILDNIKINDDLLYKHTVNLSNYDFESEVSVNILGHIFEHSLNDIDEIQAEIQGVASEQSKTKRKKDGVFYTPKYITKYIVDNTVGKLCEEKKTELYIQEVEYEKERKGRQKSTLKKLSQKLEDYRKWLLQITICDPACGSGAFLNQALEFLISEHQYIDELQAKLFGDAMVLSEVENAILENNIYGVDINEESVEIAKLSLWLRTAQKGRKLTSLNNNIKCGNSLIADPTFAGDKAFNWQNEFPEVFANGGFDVVIGNPPYVQHRKIFEYSNYFKTTYSVYTGTSDLSVYFFEKGFEILKSNKLLGYINTNKFFNTEYGKKLRDFLTTQNIDKILNFEQSSIFKDALVSSVILIASKESPDNDTTYIEFNKESIDAEKFQREITFRNRIINIDYLKNNSWLFENPIIQNLITKIQSKGSNLKETKGIKINRGLTTGYDDGFILDKEKYEKLILKDNKNNEIIKPLLKGKHIKRYFIEDSGLWLLNTHNGIKNILEAINVEKDYPTVYEYLLSKNIESKGKLEKRSDKGNHWSNLRNCAFLDEFEKEKVIWGLISGHWNFSLDTNNNYLTSASYFLTSSEIPNRFILGLLNSKLNKFYFENVGEMTAGGAYVLKKVSVEKFIIPKTSEIQQTNFCKKVKQIEKQTSSLETLQNNFISLLSSKFSLNKMSNKLIQWNYYDFSTFTKELDKVRKKTAKENETEYNKLSLSEEAEWMQYFNEQKQKAEELKAEIDKTDKEIDQMVYELYGLTEEEINIVEEATA